MEAICAPDRQKKWKELSFLSSGQLQVQGKKMECRLWKSLPYFNAGVLFFLPQKYQNNDPKLSMAWYHSTAMCLVFWKITPLIYFPIETTCGQLNRISP